MMGLNVNCERYQMHGIVGATDTGWDLLASVVVSAQIRLTFSFGFRPKVPLNFRWHVRFRPNVIRHFRPRHFRPTFGYGWSWNFHFWSTSSARYCGGSPTAVQAWRPCLLWERSPSHPILVQTRGFAGFFVSVRLLYFSVISVVCVFLQYFDTVGWVFRPVKTVARITYTVLVET